MQRGNASGFWGEQMKFSGLQFSFGLSLAVHAVAFGVAAWTGVLWGPATAPGGVGGITLTLTAAPTTVSAAPGAAVHNPIPIRATLPPPEIPPAPTAVPPAPRPQESESSPLPPEPQPPEATVSLQPAAPVVARVATAVESGARAGASSAPLGTDSVTPPGDGGVVALPSYLRNPAPPYPAEARRRRWEGTALLNVRVSAQGHAAAVSVQQSSGHTVLDEAALAAVRAWQFEPARLGPVAIESRIEVAVRFTLKR